MTQAEIDLLRNLSAPLVHAPLSWEELSTGQQAAFRLLMPAPCFTNEQRRWIDLWWLPVTEQQVNALNALCPANTAIAPREDVNGDLFASVDLLSDALDGRRLAALLPILKSLPLSYKLAEAWPLSEPQEH